MTDIVRLYELLANVKNPELQEYFAEIDALDEEALDAIGIAIEGYNPSAVIAEKRVKIKHYKYMQVSLLQALPYVLQDNTVGGNLAAVTSDWLAELIECPEIAEIYGSIDKMPEELLDILAVDFGVDWWNAEFTVAQKRRTFKQVWYVYRHMGTTSAVRAAVGAVFDSAEMQEWPAYNGKPYHFQIIVDTGNNLPNISATEMNSLEREIERYKNVRSVCDGLRFAVVKTIQEYIGVGWAEHDSATLNVSLPTSKEILTTDDGDILIDQNGEALIE